MDTAIARRHNSNLAAEKARQLLTVEVSMKMKAPYIPMALRVWYCLNQRLKMDIFEKEMPTIFLEVNSLLNLNTKEALAAKENRVACMNDWVYLIQLFLYYNEMVLEPRATDVIKYLCKTSKEGRGIMPVNHARSYGYVGMSKEYCGGFQFCLHWEAKETATTSPEVTGNQATVIQVVELETYQNIYLHELDRTRSNLLPPPGPIGDDAALRQFVEEVQQSEGLSK